MVSEMELNFTYWPGRAQANASKVWSAWISVWVQLQISLMDSIYSMGQAITVAPNTLKLGGIVRWRTLIQQSIWEAQCNLVVSTAEWDSEDLGSMPVSATGLVGDLVQVTSSPCASVSPSVKWA